MLDVDQPNSKIQRLQLAGPEALSNTTILLLPSGELLLDRFHIQSLQNSSEKIHCRI